MGWLAGRPFAELLQGLDAQDASTPMGRMLLDLRSGFGCRSCEQTFGFEFALLLASVKESYLARATEVAGDTRIISIFCKSD